VIRPARSRTSGRVKRSLLPSSSLAWKIVGPVALIWLLTALLLFAFFSWRLTARGYEDLQARLVSFADGKAAELIEPVWSFQQDALDRLMRSYRANEDLLRMTLYDEHGDILAEARGAEAPGAARTFTASRVLSRTSGGASHDIGRLDVVFHDGRLMNQLSERRSRDALMFGVFLLVFAAAVWLSIRHFVAGPLSKLKDSLQNNAVNAKKEPLIWDRRDELGDVVAAYNELLRQVEDHTGSLIVVNAELREEIDSRREAERQLRLAAMVFETSEEGIAVADADGCVQTVNPSFTRITGQTPGEAVGRDIRESVPPGIGEAKRREIWEAACEKGKFSGEAEGADPDGRRYPLRLEAIRVSGAARNMGGYVAVFRDISRQREAEEIIRRSREELESLVSLRTAELRQANEELLEMDRQRANFLSSASHELRTPLTAVMGFAKLLRRDFLRHVSPLVRDEMRADGKLKIMLQNISIIEQEGERLTRLINDLLDLNKIEAGQMVWNDEEVDAGAEVRRAVSLMNGAFSQKSGVGLDLEVGEGLPRLWVDKDRFQQLILNILSNAAKFTEQGRIRVRVVRDGDGWVRVGVEDSGPGIPDEDLERIFHKFYQSGASEPYRDKPKGTGLGLAICRNIVERYAGSIWAEAGRRGGACIVFRLPAARDGAPAQ